MLQSHHQSTMPGEDDESLAFMPLTLQEINANPNAAAATTGFGGPADQVPLYSNGLPPATSGMNSTTNMALAGETPSPSGYAEQSLESGNGPVIVAIAIPDTIRPPQIRKQVHPAVKTVKKLSIFLTGMLMAWIFYVDAYVFFFQSKYGYSTHGGTYFLVGVVWSLAFLAMLVGSVVGAIRGEWRLLAPGMVLNHIAGLIFRMAL